MGDVLVLLKELLLRDEKRAPALLFSGESHARARSYS
jgi:hypothetical protein